MKVWWIGLMALAGVGCALARGGERASMDAERSPPMPEVVYYEAPTIEIIGPNSPLRVASKAAHSASTGAPKGTTLAVSLCEGCASARASSR
jgi:hypothetical protein